MYENEKIWGICQRDRTPTTRKAEEFTNLEVSTRYSTRVEYHKMWIFVLSLVEGRKVAFRSLIICNL